MDWNVKNSLNRDKERQHLNAILADIRATVDGGTTSTTATGSTTVVQNTITRYAVARFILGLTGAVEGSATIDGLGNVTLDTVFGANSGIVTEAPKDNRYYARRNGAWEFEIPNSGEIRRRVSLGW